MNNVTKCKALKRDADGMNAAFDRLSENGRLNSETLKPLRANLHEIKIGRLRVACFWHDGDVYCTHGFVKASQKTPNRQIKHGLFMMSQFMVFMQKHGRPIVING